MYNMNETGFRVEIIQSIYIIIDFIQKSNWKVIVDKLKWIIVFECINIVIFKI